MGADWNGNKIRRTEEPMNDKTKLLIAWIAVIMGAAGFIFSVAMIIKSNL